MRARKSKETLGSFFRRLSGIAWTQYRMKKSGEKESLSSKGEEASGLKVS